MPREVNVRVIGIGKVSVSSRWTDEAISSDPKGFEEEILSELPDAIDDSKIEFTVDDAT